MKIKSLAVVPTAFLHLKGPDKLPLYDDGKPVGIELYGPGSADFARIDERQSARTIARLNENDGKVGHTPVDQRRAETTEDLADLTASFRNIEHDGPDGQPLSGRELHVAVYSDPTLGWLKEQAVKFVGDWGKFTPGASNGSPKV